ncbi:MAG: glutamine synthetase family protein [Geminicoccaceae bacterium]
MNGSRPAGAADPAEAAAFLASHADVAAVDIVLTDCHGIGRGKTIRRHELESLYRSGRGMPASIFAQDVAGEDVEGTGLVLTDGGGDFRCWPLPGTLGLLPATGRGQVLVSMFTPEGTPFAAEPRHALVRQVERAQATGFVPMGALELEFYLVDRERDAQGRVQPARYPLTSRRMEAHSTMSVDELDELSPLVEAIYAGAAALDLPLESLISEYAVGQFELTIRYRDLLRAADDVIIAKRLIRATARRFGMEACFMAKPFGRQSGSGMHLHLSLADATGRNLFADTAAGELSPLMLNAIGGIRRTIGETMLVLAPFLNSWRRFASAVYSPAGDSWGVENRTVALRVPSGSPAARHFEHRVAGIDANPYLVAAVTLGAALDGIAGNVDPGPPALGNTYAQSTNHDLPRTWLEAIDRLEASAFVREVFGQLMHRGFVAVKRAEWERLALEVTEVEWRLYGFTV